MPPFNTRIYHILGLILIKSCSNTSTIFYYFRLRLKLKSEQLTENFLKYIIQIEVETQKNLLWYLAHIKRKPLSS